MQTLTKIRRVCQQCDDISSSFKKKHQKTTTDELKQKGNKTIRTFALVGFNNDKLMVKIFFLKIFLVFQINQIIFIGDWTIIIA